MFKKKKTYKSAFPQNPVGIPRVELDKAHSPLKLLAHRELLKKFVLDEPIHPVHIRIGITNSCNIRCNFCNFHSQNETEFYDKFSYKDKLKTKDVIDFLMSFAEHGGKAVTFCGSGECTIHQGYVEICRAANEKGLKIGLITNGTRLYEENVKQCIIDTHTWVRIGLNAGTREAYKQITNYKAEAFDNIICNMKEIRKRAVQFQFRIGLNFVITAENYKEIVDAARVAKESQVYYIRFEPEFYTALGHQFIDNHMDEIKAKLEEARLLSEDSFEVSIPKLDRGQMVATDAIEGDFTRCYCSQFSTALGADGYMYPCPQVHLGGRYRMGNAIEKGYDQWIRDDDKGAWLNENFDRRKLCKTCFYRPQNELLEWLHRGELSVDEEADKFEADNPGMIHTDFL